MRRNYIVDAAHAPWKQSVTEGIGFACQVLLPGDDGGPEALRFRFQSCPSVYAHMHLTAQFQLLLSGTMDFPRGVKHLKALAVHYTDHNTPYGPFAVSDAHDMLVLHPKAGGLISMASQDARRKINLRGRILASVTEEANWRALPGVETGVYQHLIPPDLGPAAVVVRAPASASLAMPAAEFGRYEVVLGGSVIVDGREITPPGFRYLCGSGPDEPLLTGENGATVAFLTFDRDALEGGLTGDALALEAAQAMARAI
jgi:hypothetical protein